MTRIYDFNRLLVLVALTAAVTIVLAALVSAATPWNFTVPATDVKPVNGVFAFPESLFQDGKARHYEYKKSPGERIRFFVVKSTDGVIRAAFDACEVCWRAKKGYRQEGNQMICTNCGLKFRTDKVNEVTGGCNPSALKRSVNGGKVVITVQDVLAGLHYFQ